MNSIVFFAVALGLGGLGAIFYVKTSPYSRLGGAAYERRKRRRTAAMFLWVIAGLLVVLGVVTHFAGMR